MSLTEYAFIVCLLGAMAFYLALNVRHHKAEAERCREEAERWRDAATRAYVDGSQDDQEMRVRKKFVRYNPPEALLEYLQSLPDESG